MINDNSIEQSLEDLMNSHYPKTQMDVFYKGQIVLQVFNQSDVKKWSIELPLNEEGGMVINLFFHKNKEDNHERFKRADFYSDFSLKKLNKGKVNSYYVPISKNVPYKEISNRLQKIILEVYDIEKEEPLEILVRAFN
jgi:hypothetical protein